MIDEKKTLFSFSKSIIHIGDAVGEVLSQGMRTVVVVVECKGSRCMLGPLQRLDHKCPLYKRGGCRPSGYALVDRVPSEGISRFVHWILCLCYP